MNLMTETKAALRRKYDLTLAEYDRILVKQNNCCAICKRPVTSKTKADTPHADHSHTTGLVRGLLCEDCNEGVGMFDDNPELIHNAIAYLRKHST